MITIIKNVILNTIKYSNEYHKKAKEKGITIYAPQGSKETNAIISKILFKKDVYYSANR